MVTPVIRRLVTGVTNSCTVPDTGHKGLMPGVTSTFYSGILGVTVESGHTRGNVTPGIL